MRLIRGRCVSWVVLFVLAFAVGMVPGASAQCGLNIKVPKKQPKPVVWNLQSGGAYFRLATARANDDEEQAPSIVGMWHVVFNAQTMNGQPFSGTIDNSVAVWHPDGTEIMNSARPAQDGNFCLGVWEQTGRNTYFLNHIPWQGNDTENPGGIGNPQAGAQLIEKVTLSKDGNSFTGWFSLTAYNAAGQVAVVFTGSITAKRITVRTNFTDLL